MERCGKTEISGSPFTGLTATNHAVSGLSYDTYYYTVTAKTGTNVSPVSNEIAASLPTGLPNSLKGTTIYAANGKVMFTAIAGESVQVFNAVGQRLMNRVATEGVNEISLPGAKGVLLIKVGNKTAKVVL